jgi:dihydroorotase
VADLLLSGGTVFGPGGPVPADVRVSGGTVVDVATAPLDAPGAERIDCHGAWVGPGFVDVHTHLREPGQEWKEDVASGSRAAACGGYTAVVAMPNTSPPIDSGDLARSVARRGRDAGLVEVAPAGCITAGRAGERLADLEGLWDAGVRVFSDDGDSVADAGLLRRAMEFLAVRGGVISQHAVDAGLCRGGQLHEGEVARALGLPGIPAEAEEIVIARDITLARLTGARYHVQHLATADGVALVAAAKAAGLAVTAEATPHHLAFDHTAARDGDTSYKMMPPLRTRTDVAALREGLTSGVIDLVGTDHAPHSPEEKAVPWERAPFGVIGIETAAAVVHTLLDMDPVRLFTRMSVTPAAVASLPAQGRWVEPGAPANLVVFDPTVRWTPRRTLSRSRNSPYLGREWTGAVRHTVFGGRLTWSDGEIRE